MPAIIAEIEEIVEFDDLIARAMADIDDVNILNDGQDPRERQSIDINNSRNTWVTSDQLRKLSLILGIVLHLFMTYVAVT